MYSCVTFAISALFLTHNALAAPVISELTSGGSVVIVDKVSSHNTAGDDMTGIQVTVGFLNGPSQTASWAGGAFWGNTWSLTMDDTRSTTPNDNIYSTYGDPNNALGYAWWNFKYAASATDIVRSITIDGNVINSVGIAFDKINWPGSPAPIPPKSQNSANGFGFEFQGTPSNLVSDATALQITYQYNNAISLNNATPIFDLWEMLTISFGTQNDRYGLNSGSNLVFRADTDELIANPVPEPLSILLLGSGLLGLAGVRRIRRK